MAVGKIEIFLFEDGAVYCRPFDKMMIEDMKEDGHDILVGNWTYPFPNTREDSFAYGMVESFAQGDVGPMLIGEHGNIIQYTVEEGGYLS